LSSCKDLANRKDGSSLRRAVIPPDAAPLLDVLTRALGVIAVVRKRRTLVTLDTTRIHLDNVEQLGSFLEIEVVVGDDAALAVAKARFDSLLAGLGYTPADGIRASYLDLLLELEQRESRA
jgi:predicted adenylyl cyclase CyaB